MKLWACRRTQNTCGQSFNTIGIHIHDDLYSDASFYPRWEWWEGARSWCQHFGCCWPLQGVSDEHGTFKDLHGTVPNWMRPTSKRNNDNWRTSVTEAKNCSFLRPAPMKSHAKSFRLTLFFCKLVPTSFDTSLSHFYCLLLLLLHLRFSSQVLKHDYNFLGYFRKETL